MLVIVQEIVDRPDGTKGLGDTLELPVSEAVKLINDDKAVKFEGTRGVVPQEWIDSDSPVKISKKKDFDLE